MFKKVLQRILTLQKQDPFRKMKKQTFSTYIK